MSINLFPNMKRFFSLLLAAVMMVSLLAANAHAANTRKITDYGDAYGHWAYEALTWAVDNGVLVGTPTSNSMVKLYTMMRYLQFGMLNERRLQHFDSWAASFGEKVTAVELKLEGTGFRAKTRFARFFNLPELMNLWKEAADIQTADMLKLPVPEAEYVTISTEPSEAQKEMVQSLAARVERVRRGEVEPAEDNMLKITSDGRKLALDQRIARGVPPEEIAFIHQANTEVQKEELFSKVRDGKVRILLGSTQKMGAGTNARATRSQLKRLRSNQNSIRLKGA